MTKLNHLIAAARRHPEKLTSATLASVNRHLQRTGQPTIAPPAPKGVYGRVPTLAEIAAVRTGLPLPAPLLPAMTPAEYQQRQLERAQQLQAERNEKARR